MKLLLQNSLVLVLICVIGPGSLHAQFSRYGGGLSFSTGIDKLEPDRIETGNPGLTVRGIYDLNKKMFLIPGLSFYMPKKIGHQGSTLKTYYTHLDVHMGYKLAHEGPIMFYGLAGPDLTGLYLSYNTDDPNFQSKFIPSPGLSVGTGVEMIIDNSFNAFTQVRYIVGKYQQLIISIGAHYYFAGRRYKSWR